MRDVAKHPWVEQGVEISRALLDQVDDEATRAYARDEESCGLLLGPASNLRVDTIVPMPNRAAKLHALDPVTYPRTARTYFDIDPLKFERAVEHGERDGRPVKVLYHSHLDAGAYFSETDAAAMTMGGVEPAHDLAYLVTSVMKGKVDARALFVWSPDTRSFVEARLVIGTP
jgi:[CysO sulfur-carrier protein]-S-L-cysteine hydrolase